MAQKANQHFVPQYYFRRFSDGASFIHVLLKESSRVVMAAPIKGQCARRKFYGGADVEDALAKLDDQHAAVLRTFTNYAWDATASAPADEDYALLLQACLVQRSRTFLQATKSDAAFEEAQLKLFREYVMATRTDADAASILSDLDAGGVRVAQNTQVTALRNIHSALQRSPLISDLDVRIICNFTDHPFIFGDSPVVFYNSYLRRIEGRGVLGFQTPGLLIFWPLDSCTLLMLIDGTVYRGRWKDSPVVAATSLSDIAHLNVLQLHHSLHAAYFGERDAKHHVLDLWFNHKHDVVPPHVRFSVRPDLMVHREATDEVWQFFEPQINARLDLSFVECVPVDPRAYRFRTRSPRLIAEFEKRFPRLPSTTSSASSVG